MWSLGTYTWLIDLLILVYISLIGASLAQDRGRLEARIEVLSTELETQKKQNESENASLKIKAKIIDDQTETIQKLKQVQIKIYLFVFFIQMLPKVLLFC